MKIALRDRKSGEEWTGTDLGEVLHRAFGEQARLELGEEVGEHSTMHTVTDARLAYGGHAVLGSVVVTREEAE
jgi:hypothetical protein